MTRHGRLVFQAEETLHGGCLGLQKVNDLEELKTKMECGYKEYGGECVHVCVCVHECVGAEPEQWPHTGWNCEGKGADFGCRASRGRGRWSEGRRWKWGERRPFPLLGGTRQEFGRLCQ